MPRSLANLLALAITIGLAILVAGVFVTTFLRAAMSPERKTGSIGWIRAITGPNR